MSKEQLFHLARMIPKAINVEVIDYDAPLVNSEEVKYLQGKAGHMTALELHAPLELHGRNKGLPFDITKRINSFLSGASEKSDKKHAGPIKQHFDAIENMKGLGLFKPQPLDEKRVDDSTDEATVLSVTVGANKR